MIDGWMDETHTCIMIPLAFGFLFGHGALQPAFFSTWFFPWEAYGVPQNHSISTHVFEICAIAVHVKSILHHLCNCSLTSYDQ